MKLRQLSVVFVTALFSTMSFAGDLNSEAFKKIVNRVVAGPFKQSALSLIQKEVIKDIRIENGRALIDIDTSKKYFEVTYNWLSNNSETINLPAVLTIPFPKDSDLVESLTVIAGVPVSYLASKDYQNLIQDMGMSLAGQSVEPDDLFIEVLKISRRDTTTGQSFQVFVGAHFKPNSSSLSDGMFSNNSCDMNACWGGAQTEIKLKK